MKKIEIKIKEDIYIVELALTEEEQYKGLSGRESLAEKEGMLFIFKEEKSPYFVMRNMDFPLDFLFIDKDNKIIDIQTGEVDSKDHYEVDETIKAILELTPEESTAVGV